MLQLLNRLTLKACYRVALCLASSTTACFAESPCTPSVILESLKHPIVEIHRIQDLPTIIEEKIRGPIEDFPLSSEPEVLKRIKILKRLNEQSRLVANPEEDWNSGCVQEPKVPGRKMHFAGRVGNMWFANIGSGSLVSRSTLHFFCLKDEEIIGTSDYLALPKVKALSDLSTVLRAECFDSAEHPLSAAVKMRCRQHQRELDAYSRAREKEGYLSTSPSGAVLYQNKKGVSPIYTFPRR